MAELQTIEPRQAAQWAQEETLKEIADHVRTLTDYQRVSDSVNARKDKVIAKDDKDTAKKAASSMGALTTFAKFSSRSLTKLIKATIAGGTSVETVIKRGVQEQIQAIDNLGSKGGIGKLLSFGGLLGVAAITAVNLFIDKIGEANETFNSLYDTGFAFSGQLGLMYIEAGKARMSLSEFASALSEHSLAIKHLSNDYESGSSVFAQLTAGIKKSIQNNGMLALSTAEITDYLGEYLETQRLQGRLEQFNKIREQQNMTRYLETLTKLTLISGKRRKQIFDEVQSFQRQANISNIMASVPAEMADSFKDVIAQLSAKDLPPVFKEGFAEMFANSGAFMTAETAKVFTLLGQGATDAMRDMIGFIRAGGKPTLKQLEALTSGLKESAQQAIASGQAYTLAQAGLAGIGDFATSSEAIQAALAIMEGNVDDLSVTMGALQKLLNTGRDLWDKLTSQFDIKLGDMITQLSTWLGDEKTFDTMVSAFEAVAGMLDSFLGSDGLNKTLDAFVVAVGIGIKTFLSLFTEKGRDEIKDEIIGALKDIIKWIGETIVDGILDALNPFTSLPAEHPANMTFEERQEALQNAVTTARVEAKEQESQESLARVEEIRRNPRAYLESTLPQTRAAVHRRGRDAPVVSSLSDKDFKALQDLQRAIEEAEKAEKLRHESIVQGVLKMNKNLDRINGSVQKNGQPF